MLTALSRRYPERYVAMAGDRVLAIGKDQFRVLKVADKKKKKKEMLSLYYLPGKKKPLYLLKATGDHSL